MSLSITYTQMSASRARKAVGMGALLLTNADVLRIYISPTTICGEETSWC